MTKVKRVEDIKVGDIITTKVKNQLITVKAESIKTLMSKLKELKILSRVTLNKLVEVESEITVVHDQLRIAVINNSNKNGRKKQNG